jgi:hypothetical protein
MPTYIEKEVLMDEIEKYCGDYFCHDEDSFDKSAVRIAIKLAPTADVAPVRRGEWKRDEHDHMTCTMCGEPPVHNGRVWIITPYCPNCGAKMEEGGAEK